MPECYVERLDALRHCYNALSDMRADLVSIREGLSSAEAQRQIDERPSNCALICWLARRGVHQAVTLPAAEIPPTVNLAAAASAL